MSDAMSVVDRGGATQDSHVSVRLSAVITLTKNRYDYAVNTAFVPFILFYSNLGGIYHDRRLS